MVDNQFPNETSKSNEDPMRKISPTETSGGNGMRRLQHEINTLTKRNCGKFVAIVVDNNIFLC